MKDAGEETDKEDVDAYYINVKSEKWKYRIKIWVLFQHHKPKVKIEQKKNSSNKEKDDDCSNDKADWKMTTKLREKTEKIKQRQTTKKL